MRARALGTRLSSSLGHSVLIDNRPGAGTTIASGIERWRRLAAELKLELN